MLKPLRQPGHEEVLTERYAELRRSALHLTQGHEAEAEDLLHDTAVRFMLLRPSLATIDNLDGYLYTMLRNVHLSRCRRFVVASATVEGAEVQDWLASLVHPADLADRLSFREDLGRIVEHLCARKRVSKAASAFILQCFHGYYPSEIAQLMRISPAGVDRVLSLARRETMDVLAAPVVRRRPPLRLVRPWPALSADDPADYCRWLRDRIYASREGACLASDEVAARYADDGPLAADVLAHVVACEPCLECVNRHLGLPPLAARHPMETRGTRGRRGGPPSVPPGAGAGSGKGAAGLVRRARHTLASLDDHVPRELRITANGLELGSQQVASPESVQELRVRLAESLAFIEIFDERGVVLCYWPARVEVDGEAEPSVTIALAHGGRFDLRVSPGDGCPRLRVRYTDRRVTSRGRVVDVPADHAPAPMGIASRGFGARETQQAWQWRAWQWRGWLRPAYAGTVALFLLLWLTFVGPEATWAAVARAGRATVAVLRTLFVSDAPESSDPSSRVLPTSRVKPDLLAFLPAPSGLGRRVVVTGSSLGRAELAELEVAARVTLHMLGADLGEDVALAVTPQGVTVGGVVEGVARRDAVERAFAGQRGVRVRLRTIAELSVASRAGQAPGTATPHTPKAGLAPAVSPTHPDADFGAQTAAPLRLPMDAGLPPVLSDALRKQFPEAAEREAFVNRVLDRANNGLARAWALRRLAARYSPRDVERLTPRSRQAITSVAQDHAVELRHAVDSMATLMSPLLASATGSAARESVSSLSLPAAEQVSHESASGFIDAWASERLFAQMQQARTHVRMLLTNGDLEMDAATGARAFLVIVRQLQTQLSQSAFGSELQTPEPKPEP